jgi:hypothetical protein
MVRLDHAALQTALAWLLTGKSVALVGQRSVSRLLAAVLVAEAGRVAGICTGFRLGSAPAVIPRLQDDVSSGLWTICLDEGDGTETLDVIVRATDFSGAGAAWRLLLLLDLPLADAIRRVPHDLRRGFAFVEVQPG